MPSVKEADTPTLRELRIRSALSIRELATKADVAPRTIVQTEAGRSVPRYSTMRRIALALGVEPADVTEFSAAIEGALRGEAAG